MKIRTKIGITLATSLLIFSANALAQSPLCLFGCANADINTKDFVAASKNLIEAAKKLGAFDPLGVKALLENNVELQKQLAGVSTQLAGFTVGEPVIVLAGQLLRFRVAQSSGSFRIKLWIDDEANHTIVDRHPVFDQAYDLPLPTGDQVIKPTLLTRQ